MIKSLPRLLGRSGVAQRNMSLRKTWGAVVCLLWSVHFVYGQQDLVTGKVLSSDDQLPIPGVTVTLKGTSTGTVTDVSGSYSLPVSDPEGVLVFSFVGYATQELPINGRSIINVTLTTDTQDLGEVV